MHIFFISLQTHRELQLTRSHSAEVGFCGNNVGKQQVARTALSDVLSARPAQKMPASWQCKAAVSRLCYNLKHSAETASSWN